MEVCNQKALSTNVGKTQPDLQKLSCQLQKLLGRGFSVVVENEAVQAFGNSTTSDGVDDPDY